MINCRTQVKSKLSPEEAERFYSKIQKTESCWVWSGAGNGPRFKYGRFHCQGTYIMAHRLSFLLHVGNIPDGLFVCHKCDNPQCVNPNHLFLGTPGDNTRDMMAKGRQVKVRLYGQRHPQCRLTTSQVEEIRALGGTLFQKEIAAKFGVHQSTISYILSGKIRTHG